MGYMDEQDLRRELERMDGFVGVYAEIPARRLSEREVERVVEDYERDSGRYVSYSDRQLLRRASRSY